GSFLTTMYVPVRASLSQKRARSGQCRWSRSTRRLRTLGIEAVDGQLHQLRPCRRVVDHGVGRSRVAGCRGQVRKALHLAGGMEDGEIEALLVMRGRRRERVPVDGEPVQLHEDLVAASPELSAVSVIDCGDPWRRGPLWIWPERS